MTIITDDVHRALTYILLLNDNGAYPTPKNVDDFIQTKLPDASRSGSKWNSLISQQVLGGLLDPQWKAGEPVAKYLENMGWVLLGKQNGKLAITTLGRALCMSLESEKSLMGNAATVYTSTPEKPIALSQLTSMLNQSQGELYVDPFMEADHVEWIANNTPVRRIVTGSRFASEIKLRMKEVRLPPELEVRIFSGKQLHDRGAVHANGGVAIVGTSVNGMRDKYVAMVDLPPEVSGAYRNLLEEIWAKSKKIDAYYPSSGSKSRKTKS